MNERKHKSRGKPSLPMAFEMVRDLWIFFFFSPPSVDLVPEFAEIDKANPNCVVIGDAAENFTYANLNEAFRVLIGMEKPVLISLGRGWVKHCFFFKSLYFLISPSVFVLNGGQILVWAFTVPISKLLIYVSGLGGWCAQIPVNEKPSVGNQSPNLASCPESLIAFAGV